MHLDLSNTKIEDSTVSEISRIVQSSPELISLGLDIGFAKNLTESGLASLVSGIFERKERFSSLALGFGGLQVVTSPLIEKLVEQLKNQQNSLRFLRLNFSDVKIEAADLEKISSVISSLDLEHLELYCGGNRSVGDKFLKQMMRYMQSNSKLKSFVLDVGYTSCSKKALKSCLKTPKLGLNTLGLYLNG